MDETFESTKDSGFGTLAQVKVIDFPTPMDNVTEILPTQPLGSIDSPKLKLTPKSPSRVMSQDSILAMHWLNTPLKEGSILVPYMFEQIRAVVDSYQLQHEDAFYAQYPDLLILKKGEPQPDSTSLRVNHKLYDKRLAHKIFHYLNAANMYSASLANLCILSNVNGTGQFKAFGLACRISQINTAANRFGFYPMPTGLLSKLSAYSKFAVGKTSFGATFVSIPTWITDVFGNRGDHSIDLISNLAAIADTGDDFTVLDKSKWDGQAATALTANMYKIARMYGYEYPYADADGNNTHPNRVAATINPDGSRHANPSCPHIENAAAFGYSRVYDTGDEDKPSLNSDNVLFKLAADGSDLYFGNSFVKRSDGKPGSLNTDNIISRAWDTFNFWQNYMELYFHDFSEEMSQIRDLVVRILKVCESGMDAYKFYSSINTDHFFDARDLLSHMTFKKDNQVNTATVIKWSPIIDSPANTWMDEDFDDNFNRYPVDEESTVDYLKLTELWPRLTPTVFQDVDNTNGEAAPYVANSIKTPATVLDNEMYDKDTFIYAGAKAPVGRYASLLDLASCSNTDPHSTAVDVIAINPDDALRFVKSNNGIIIKERPTTPLIYEQPLIDVTDPMQCGFTLIISSDAKTKDEFSEWYTNPANYIQVAEDKDPPLVYSVPNGWGDGSTSTPFYPTQPAFGKVSVGSGSSKKDYVGKAHVSNPGYLDYIKHACIFVGDNIFSHPVTSGGKLSAGNPAERFYFKKSTKVKDWINAFKTAVASLSASNSKKLSMLSLGDMDEIIMAALTLASSQSVPSDTIYDGFVKPIDLISKLLQEASSSVQADKDRLYLKSFVFDPSYGPVSPAVYDVPAINFHAQQPLQYDDDEVDDDVVCDNAAPLFPKVAFKNVGSTSEVVQYSPSLANRRPKWRPIDTPATFWIWFLDNIKFTRIGYSGITPVMKEKPINLIGFSSGAKAQLAVISRSTVFFTGVEDTKPLYQLDKDQLSSKDISVAASGSIKYSTLVLTPKVVSTRLKGGASAAPAKAPKTVVTTRSQAVDMNQGMKADDRTGSQSPRGRALKSGRRNSGGGSKSPRNIPDEVKVTRKCDPDDHDKELDGMYDASTRKQDKDFAKSKDSKFPATSVLNS